MGNPPVTGRRLGYCNCGRLVHWEDLRMARDVFLQPQSENRLTYSSYNSALWTCDDAADAGAISEGPFLHNYTITYDTDNNASESGGSQTWTGTGTLRTKNGTDCSSATSICFAFEVGPYHRSESPALTIESGLCNSDGSSLFAEKTLTDSVGQRKVYWSKNIADIDSSLSASELYFYIKVTPVSGQKWFADRVQLEFNKSEPGVFVATSGTATAYSSQQRIWRVVRTCPDCRLYLTKTIDTTVIVEQPTLPIPVGIETEIV